jgi:hypothetical protein
LLVFIFSVNTLMSFCSSLSCWTFAAISLIQDFVLRFWRLCFFVAGLWCFRNFSCQLSRSCLLIFDNIASSLGDRIGLAAGQWVLSRFLPWGLGGSKLEPSAFGVLSNHTRGDVFQQVSYGRSLLELFWQNMLGRRTFQGASIMGAIKVCLQAAHYLSAQ